MKTKRTKTEQRAIWRKQNKRWLKSMTGEERRAMWRKYGKAYRARLKAKAPAKEAA
jgi:hypothetical protein